MDINTLRAAITVVSFLIFIGIIAWSVSPKNRSRFDQAAQVPFDDDDALDRQAITSGK